MKLKTLHQVLKGVSWTLHLIALATASIPNGCPYIQLGTRAVRNNKNGHWFLPVTCGTAGNHGNARYTLKLLNPLGNDVVAHSSFANGTSTFLMSERATPGLYKCFRTGEHFMTRCPRAKAAVHVTRFDVMWAISEARLEEETQEQRAEHHRLSTLYEHRIQNLRAEIQRLKSLCEHRIHNLRADNQRRTMLYETRIQNLTAEKLGLKVVCEDRVQNMAKETQKQTIMLLQNCQDVYRYNTTSGVATVYPGRTPVTVYCDQDTPPGGWTVIQRRLDGRENFTRNWHDYEVGFGALREEFWLGLSAIHRLTTSGNYSLRVELEDFDDSTGYALYDTFYIDGACCNYTLHVAGYNGTIGDSLIMEGMNGPHDNMQFSTPDRDNDLYINYNCARGISSGWWFNDCFDANLNGPYGIAEKRDGYVTWYSWHNDTNTYRRAEMKIRPRD